MYKIKNLSRLIDTDEIMELLHKCLNSKHKKISLLTKGDKPNILSVKTIPLNDILEAIKKGQVSA